MSRRGRQPRPSSPVRAASSREATAETSRLEAARTGRCASPLILASASPRRQEILRLAGIEFEVVTSDAEAGLSTAGKPETVALTGARAKALDVASRVPEGLVLGADTVVALGGQVLGKPRDAAHARRMLEQLSGRQHRVHTAFALVVAGRTELEAEACETSAVTFRVLDSATIDAYVATGDPLDKAGAYGIQSGGGALVAEVIGSYLNVVGVPLAAILKALARTAEPTVLVTA